MTDPVHRLAAALTDRYHIERELGAGGMATVYLAHDVRHDRKVALKVLRPELSAILGGERFLQEIRVTANLQHPHILPLFDSGDADGLLFYVMPYVPGETLRDRLTREKQLGVDEAVRLTAQVASALDYAHRTGVVHRDIKPENVLIHDGQAVVADFGIALAVRNAGGARLTETGLSLGTPHYMSPEQATADRELDARSDIYSLGCVLYELLAGEPPHTGATAQAVIAKIITDRPRPVRELRDTVPQHVDLALRTALAKLPADRFRTAQDFAAALEARGPAGLTVETAPPAVVVATRPSLRAVAPWIIAALLAVAAAAGWVTKHDRSVGTVRLSATLPDAKAQYGPYLRVSPDGRQVVIVASGATREVLVRSLDRDSFIAVPGANGGERPFLSADGRWLAFEREGRLWKVPLAGGTPVDLTDVQWGGGSWSSDGRIIYTRNYQSGLWEVSADGGEARELSTPDSASGELGHWWPQVLPGDRRVLFTAFRAPIESSTVEVFDLDTRRRHLLVRGAISGRYVSTGHLLFARDETVLAVPFDLGALRVTGSPVAVVADVAIDPSNGYAAYDVSAAGTLVYLPSSVYWADRLVTEVDRRGNERRVLPAAGRYADPRLSPDGRRFALTVTPPGGTSDIWVHDPARGTATRVTSHGASDFGAEWVNGGREIVYMSERPLFELYRREADASRPERPFLTGGADRIIGAVSADGRLLGFMFSQPADQQLWTVQVDSAATARQYLASEFDLSHPAPSPDARWLAYDSDESGRIEVYVQSYPDPTGSRRQLSSGGGSEPLWTRGGREIVFRRGGTVMAASFDPATGEAGRPVPLFTGPYLDETDATRTRSWDAARDGERFLLLRWPPERGSPRVEVVLGWLRDLEQLVGR